MKSLTGHNVETVKTFAVGRRRRRIARSALRTLVGLAVVIALVGGAAAADTLAYRNRIRPGTTVGSLTIGGQTPAVARRTLAALAEVRSAHPVEFRWSDQVFAAPLGQLGWSPDLDATLRDAMAIGRSGVFWEDVRTRAETWVRPTVVPWRATLDLARAQPVAERWDAVVGRAPVEGRVWIEHGLLRRREPVPGWAVDLHEVTRLASGTADEDPEAPFDLPLRRVPPATTRDDVDAAVEDIRRIVSGAVRLRVGPRRVEIAAEELAPLIRTRVEGGGGDAALEVRLRPGGVEELLEPHRRDAEVAPREARLEVRGDRVAIVRSKPGRRLDARLAAEDLLRIARSPSRSGRIRLAPVDPSFTTEDAEALGIRELVSEFTTFHAAGEPRVRNIHLAADYLDGSIVLPEEVFSMNERLGERTTARGFVAAPAIYDGRLVQAVGGGVSQFATTLFNAAFFGGYPILESQAHSYYISRYPLGREATVSWPRPDLRFRNDTPTAIMINTAYSASSITVRIFGDRHGRRAIATDPVIVGSSATGYTVRVRRIVEGPGNERREETFLTFYRHGSPAT